MEQESKTNKNSIMLLMTVNVKAKIFNVKAKISKIGFAIWERFPI